MNLLKIRHLNITTHNNNLVFRLKKYESLDYSTEMKAASEYFQLIATQNSHVNSEFLIDDINYLEDLYEKLARKKQNSAMEWLEQRLPLYTLALESKKILNSNFDLILDYAEGKVLQNLERLKTEALK
jgi:hypothetical protein